LEALNCLIDFKQANIKGGDTMKRILLITFLIVGLTAAYSFAQMGQGHMGGQGMMGTQTQQQPGERPYSQTPYGGGNYACTMGQGMMGYGGYGMMGPGMMGHMAGMMGQGHMGGYGMMGRGHMGGYGTREYNPEAYQKYQEQHQKFLDDTADLRKKLHNKKFDYFEAVRNPDTKRGTVMKIEKEILDLQWDIYEKSPR
jgi:hypothetical protein